MRQAPLPQGFATLQSRQDQSDGAEHEVRARATRDAHHLLTVDGQIVAQHSETEAEGHHVQTYQPAPHQEETVPRQRNMKCRRTILTPHSTLHIPRLQINRRIHRPTADGHDQCDPEEQFEAVGILIHKDAHRWGDGHREIVRQPVVADALRPATRWQHIDGHRRVRHRQCPEGSAVQRSDDEEQQQGRCRQIACEEDGKQAETDHEHRLSGERVHEIAAEGPQQQGGDGVAREHQTYHVLRGSEVLTQVEWQQRGQYVEGKEQREVRRHHLTIVPIP